MKVTLSWLKDYVDFDWSPEELADRLTMIGLEVEGIEVYPPAFEGVVVAQVLSKAQHPNADRLSVCRVADGSGERQIVCGATNFDEGDKVPLILPGASLPVEPGEKPFVIKVGKIRGVESHGMMCSPGELKIEGDSSGLYILPSDTEVGSPFAEFMGKPTQPDVVYDLEVTPNRPDLNSVIGIAREISAVTGNALKMPAIALKESGEEKVENAVAVRIDADSACPRYNARVIRGVTVGASPEWLRTRLERLGIRSINNVVDVTNYVMMETGQPLHAFDYHLLKASEGQSLPTIVVRTAEGGESFQTLDEVKRALRPEDLLIADETQAVALAGVMGGLNSEISDSTNDVLLETAYFEPRGIRKTSKQLALSTDASYRFERGADPEICEWVSQRAASLIIQVAGGEALVGSVDAWPLKQERRRIQLRFRKVSDLLGIQVEVSACRQFLTRLELTEISADDQIGVYEIPSFRVDLKREVDLIEEIARLNGLDKIIPSAPAAAAGRHPFDAVHDRLAGMRQTLSGMGMAEAQGQTLIDHSSALWVSADEKLIRLERPLSSDMDVLRPSLLPGLLHSLGNNAAHGNRSVALFEIGKTFHACEEGFSEKCQLGIALTGFANASFWGSDERPFDVFDLKGLLEVFLESLRVGNVTFKNESVEGNFYVELGGLYQGKHCVGRIGQVNPKLARERELRDPVYVAEVELDWILTRKPKAAKFETVSPFPAIRRDVAIEVANSVTHNDILAAVKKAKPKHLDEVNLFDVFRGKGIQEGHKSVAYALTYRTSERTLTDGEVNKMHDKVLKTLESELGAKFR